MPSPVLARVAALSRGAACPELRLHLRRRLEAAAGEDHAAPRADREHHAILPLHRETDDFAGRIAQEARRGMAEAQVDAARAHMVVQYLEDVHALPTAHMRIFLGGIEIRHALDDDRRDVLVAFERVVAQPVVGLDDGATRTRELADVVVEADHVLGEGAQHVIGRAPVIGGTQIL